MDSIAWIHRNQGQYTKAVDQYLQAITLMKQKLGPAHGMTINTMQDLARTYEAMGSYAEQERLYEEILETRTSKDGRDHRETLEFMNVLAKHYANCADPDARNARRAVELATQAVEGAPQVGHIWHTLGIAHYRAEDWNASLQAMEKTMQLRGRGDAYEWYFLAMIHTELGDLDEARKWHKDATQWMERDQPTDEELKRIRAEADLKMNNQSPPTT